MVDDVSEPADAPEPAPGSALRRDLRRSLIEGVFFSLMVGLGETYLAPFALSTGVSEATAGLLATVPLVAGGVFQLIAPSAMRVARSYRSWSSTWATFQALAFVPLVAAAAAGGAPTALIFGAASLYWAAGMAIAPAWNAWMSAMIPPRIRPRYFARRQGAGQLGILGGLLGGGAVLELCHRLAVPALGFAILFGAALACRLISSALLRSQSLPIGNPRPRPIDIHVIVRRAFRSERRAVIACLVGVTAGVNVGGAFLPSYVLVEGGMSYGAYTATLACFLFGKVVMYRVLARFTRRLDVKLLLLFGGIGIAPLPLLWLLSIDPWFIGAAQLLSGVTWATFELGTILSFLDVPDEVERTSLLSVYYALNSAAAATAALIGAALFAAAGGGMAGYTIIFLASSATRAIALVALLYRARREAVRALPAILSFAIRPWGGGVIRPVLATLGLGREGTEDGEVDDEAVEVERKDRDGGG